MPSLLPRSLVGSTSRFATLRYFWGGWPRKLAVVACLLLAVISATTGWPDQTGTTDHDETEVVVAARAVAAGSVLDNADVTVSRRAVSDLPTGVFASSTAVVGHRVASSLAPRELITDARLLDVSVSSALKPGQVAVALALPDRNQAAIITNGATIDLYGAAQPNALVDGRPLSESAPGSAEPGSQPIASSVRVLAVYPTSAGSSSSLVPSSSNASGGLTLVIATNSVTASRLANRLYGTLLATLRPTS